MIELTQEQQQALGKNGREPVRLIDPATTLEYVLVPAQVYDRLKTLISQDAEWVHDANGTVDRLRLFLTPKPISI